VAADLRAAGLSVTNSIRCTAEDAEGAEVPILRSDEPVYTKIAKVATRSGLSFR
jgi:hypothetical protein